MVNIRKFLQGLGLIPVSSTAIDTKGELEVLDASGKLNYHNGTTASPVVTEAHSSTLTNKSIDADTNTITNIENADIKAGAAIDADKIADGSVSNTEFQYLANVTSDIQTQLNATASTTALNNHINDASDAHDASAISNVPAGSIAATDVQAAINELDGDLTTHTGASSGVHGVTGSVVGTTDSQTLTNKTLTAPTTDVVTWDDQTTPSNPAAGFYKTYFKNDGVLYRLDSGGTETAISGTSGITELTGDVTAGPGSGSQAATIAADSVTNSKLANMATQTIKGRTTAGSGDPEDLSATQATAILNNFVGDSGSGGTKGLVPAPASGDAAANKFLKADGTWATAGGGGGTITDVSGTIGFTGWGTVTNIAVYEQVVGNYAKYWGHATLGTLTGSTASIDLPSGRLIDYTKISTASTGSMVGHIVQNSFTGTNSIYAGNWASFLIVDGTDTGKIFHAYQMNSSGFIKLTGSGLYVGGYTITFEFSIPIQ